MNISDKLLKLLGVYGYNSASCGYSVILTIYFNTNRTLKADKIHLQRFVEKYAEWSSFNGRENAILSFRQNVWCNGPHQGKHAVVCKGYQLYQQQKQKVDCVILR